MQINGSLKNHTHQQESIGITKGTISGNNFGGWFKFPNGLIIQYGDFQNGKIDYRGSIRDRTYTNKISFPINFPTSVILIFVINSALTEIYHPKSYSNSGFTVNARMEYRWIAFGY